MPILSDTRNLFKAFFQSTRAGGFLLVACTGVSLILANSSIGPWYRSFWHTPLPIERLGISLTLEHWINEGLMTVFFLLVALEIERQLYIGDLSGGRRAVFPVLAAIGGMIVPIIIYIAFNHGYETISGFGIPMATDIAFALGVLSLLGNRIPRALVIFLAALAIIDDLGAILAIAFFYADAVKWIFLLIATGIYTGLLVLNRLRIGNLFLYLIPGAVIWYCLLKSGIQPTLAGVLLAFAVPFARDDACNPSHHLQRRLHIPVSFVILPLFALANTAIVIPSELPQALSSRTSVSIMTALLAGKTIGIFSFAFLSVRLGICVAPPEVSWRHIFGVAVLGGIGFTMSIFITNLSFADPSLINASKISILLVSACAAVLGFLILRFAKTRATG